MADWDDEDFEPPTIDKLAPATDQWEGEDQDEDVKDNWDDDDEEEKKPAAPASEGKTEEPKTGKKKALAKKLKEKEEAAARLAEAKRLAEAAKTPEEKMADKLRAQKLAQESDLEVAKDTFGVSAIDVNKVTIDNFNPTTNEDFTNFEKMLSEKFRNYESSPHYESFLDNLFRNSCLCLDAESLKKIISSLNVLQNEKAKQERQKKGGKKTTKAKLAGGTKGGSKDEFVDYTYDDMDDFM